METREQSKRYSGILLPSSPPPLTQSRLAGYSKQQQRLDQAVSGKLNGLHHFLTGFAAFPILKCCRYKGNRKGLSIHPQTRIEHVEASGRPDFKSQGPRIQKLTIQVHLQQTKQEPSVRNTHSGRELCRAGCRGCRTQRSRSLKSAVQHLGKK